MQPTPQAVGRERNSPGARKKKFATNGNTAGTHFVNFPPALSFPSCAFSPTSAINNEPRECGSLGVVFASLVCAWHLMF
jgi:hypothetical protein